MFLQDPSDHWFCYNGDKLFDSLHNLSHPGIQATQKLITSRFVWLGINTDVRRWARSCTQCQKAKVHRHSSTAFFPFCTPDAHFDFVHVDLFGPLPSSRGYIYLLALITTHDGLKHYLSVPSQLWHMPFYMDGFHDLEFLCQSLQMVVISLSQNSGNVS